MGKLRRVNPEFCFEVVNEERGIIFELPSDEKLAIMSDEEAAYVAKEKGEKGLEDPKLLLAEMNMKKRVIENGEHFPDILHPSTIATHLPHNTPPPPSAILW